MYERLLIIKNTRNQMLNLITQTNEELRREDLACYSDYCLKNP